MNIHEYQAKALLKDLNIPVPDGVMITSSDDVESALSQLKNPWVVKAQIHAGGRGKAGGVKVVHTKDDVHNIVDKLLGKPLVTEQTGPQGQVVQKIYIEEACNIKKEFYLSLLIDRATSRLTIIASAEGGMDIEEIAHKAPHKIIRVSIDPTIGYQAFYGRKIAYKLGLSSSAEKQFMRLIESLYKAFMTFDMNLVEINPLVETTEGNLLALDAKGSFDDNALFRHPESKALEDPNEIDPFEKKASEHDLNYVKLDGNIGCMVNGAGLAMATMDLIKLYGGSAANFLDVGGGATRERITEAFKIILSDKNVKGIFVNIFGGIMRCEIIAEGIIAAARLVSLQLPLVVRLEGTNVDLGKKLFQESGLPIIVMDDFSAAAQQIITEVNRSLV